MKFGYTTNIYIAFVLLVIEILIFCLAIKQIKSKYVLKILQIFLYLKMFLKYPIIALLVSMLNTNDTDNYTISIQILSKFTTIFVLFFISITDYIINEYECTCLLQISNCNI